MGIGAGLYMCDVVKKFTFAISSPDEFLYRACQPISAQQIELHACAVPHALTRCGNRRISSCANVSTQPLIAGTTTSADSRVGSIAAAAASVAHTHRSVRRVTELM